jgi:hypothetical protein
MDKFEEKVLTFDGTGAALIGEEALQKEGLAVWVMARPISLGAQCGFCLRVLPVELARAVRVLTAAQVKIRGVYDRLLNDQGHSTYVEVPRATWSSNL